MHIDYPWALLGLLVVYSSCGNQHAYSTTAAAAPAASFPAISDRLACQQGDAAPANRINSTARLLALRQQMEGWTGGGGGAGGGLQAYIIPMGDYHQSEYTSAYDKRVEFVSGFSGSAGIAVVVSRGVGSADNIAALWTDGRYSLQADEQLDCNWILMKTSEARTPTVTQWLPTVLNGGERVAADARIVNYDKWSGTNRTLGSVGVTYHNVPDLVDIAWAEMMQQDADFEFPRHPRENNPLEIHDIQYAGVGVSDKIERVRRALGEERSVEPVDMAVYTALDETAWLFNLRGRDIAYNPVFYTYTMVLANETRLYLQNPDQLLTTEIQDHLQVDEQGRCRHDSQQCITVRPYDTFISDLVTASDNKVVWVSPMSGYAVYQAVEQYGNVHLRPSVIRLMKGIKNSVELENLRNCYKKDSAALVKFLAFLEKEIQEGKHSWDEISAAEILTTYRQAVDTYRSLSFDTISAFGANGAVIHYSPSNITNVHITARGMYLLDSGGQYLDGTTDVTRTMHYGVPTAMEKEAYTAVLQGSIDLASTVWLNGSYGRDIDIAARRPLWALGLDYQHGTGHGIGMYLHVHEGPGRINLGYRKRAYESPLYTGMIFSDEPGYYQKGEFGVRLETVVEVVEANTKYHFGDKAYLGFEVLTLVPFEPNLINYSELSQQQIAWLDMYNERCRQEIGALVQDDSVAYEWLMQRTQPVAAAHRGDGTASTPASITIICAIICSIICVLSLE